MKFLILLILIPFLAFAESGVTNNFKIAGNSTTSKNLVNGSFESGANTGWTVGAGTLTATTAERVQGLDSGLWSVTGAGTIDLCATPTNLASTDLIASGWIKSTSTDLQVCSVINSVENGCTPLGTITGWKKFAANGTYASGNFCFRLKSVASGAITAYVDDVKVEPLEYLYANTGTVTQSWQDGTEWKSETYTTVNGWSGNQGLGTFTAGTVEWKKSGGDLLYKGRLTLGTTTASEARLALPNGLVSADSTKIGLVQPCGTINSSNQQIVTYVPLITQSNNYVRFGYYTSGNASALTAVNGNDIFTSGVVISFNMRIPIAGWSSLPTIYAVPNRLEVFSANVSSSGTVTNASSNFVTSCTNAAPSVCTLAALFGNTPICWAHPIDITKRADVTTSSTSSVTVGRTDTSTAFNLFCHLK